MSEKQESIVEQIGRQIGLRERHQELLQDLELHFEFYLGALLVVSFTGLMTLKVVSRVFLPITFDWIQEVTIGMFIWASWLGVVSLIRTDNHIRFTLVLNRLSERGVYAIYVIEWIIWLITAGVIVRYSITWVQQYMNSGSTIIGTTIPKWIIFLVIPVTFTMMIVRVLQQAVIITRKYRAGQNLTTGVDIGSEGME